MSHWSEAQVIDEIERTFPLRRELTPRGIGDDCALMAEGFTLISSDASVEGVHFDLSFMSVADAAWRCLASNISDIAAMGAIPGPFTLALGLPKDTPFDDISDAIHALIECISAHHADQCWLIGGDVVRSPNLFFAVTILGKPSTPHPIMRNGAKPGDHILVVGNIGHAAAGLECLQNPQRIDTPELQKIALPFIRAFKRPVALTKFALKLAHNHLASAMMDTSDGIRTDLPRLLKQSQCGAQVFFDRLVPSRDMTKIAYALGRDPKNWMICGGEDFGLLMTCRQNHVKTILDLASEFSLAAADIGLCNNSGIQWIENQAPSTRSDSSFSHF